MQKKEFSTEIGGKTLTATFTDLAEQANGSVLLRSGNTIVLATAVMGESERAGLDYFPLTVDYEEKFYAAGQILGSRFMRREGRPSDEAILSGRAVDRTIRPLFPQHIRRDVQVVITVLSIEKDDPDVLAINAASLALATSNIPWNGPVSAVRIGRKRGADEWLVNPDYVSRTEDTMLVEIVACGKDGKLNMIEAGAKELPESLAVEALTKASEEIEKMQTFQKMIIEELGKEKASLPAPEISPEMLSLWDEVIAPNLNAAVFTKTTGNSGIHELQHAWESAVSERLPDASMTRALALFETNIDKAIHEGALKHNERADGRAFNEVRTLFAAAGGVSPILHGSGIFYRGQTHVLSVLTLGGPQDAQLIDGMEVQEKKRFLHHYNFPPFSSGETGKMGGTNRRMIGHGALAEKALAAVLPPKETFPYTIRIVSEVMSSNGSTSMASVCAGTLALMDAGVPIGAPVAGIAMGLMSDAHDNYKILTDIQGPEDHYGDMDFKVAGTRNGINAIQMDIKVDAIPLSVLTEAFEHAKQARLHILDVIEQAIATPRADISPNAPKIISITIRKDQIGAVIGGGGKVVNGIKELTGADIDIEDDGTIYITGKNGSAEKARDIILQITHEYKAGERFEGEVTRLMDFGAFVKIGANAEGLVHVSEVAPYRIASIADAVAVGERVQVAVKEVDEKGRINLSIKDADPEFAKRKGIKEDTHPRPTSPPRRPMRR